MNVFKVDGSPVEPLRDVVIRVSDSAQTDSGEDGQLKVQSCVLGQSILAWAPGYEITSLPCGGQPSYDIPLYHLQAVDNTYYAWSSAINDCNRCHGNPSIANPVTGASFDEVNEWLRSGHATVFWDGYFSSMYRGTTLSGKLGRPASPVIIGNEWVPVPPEMNQDYHGPGFRLDFPQQPGNCSYCHAPAAVGAGQEAAHLDNPSPGGVEGEGVTCDVCHKVFDVILADNGFPFPDKLGVRSFQLLRPNNGMFMTGPFKNTIRTGLGVPANHRLTCAPIFSRSEFCAPCHFGRFGDMVVYNSYGEWRASPYAANPADPSYRTCQDCHMSQMEVGDRAWLSSQRQACTAGDPRFQNFSHNVMNHGPDKTGREIPRLVQNAAEIGVNFDSQPTGTNALDVIVSVSNMRAGHNFPTDSPLRHLILVVTAKDRVGTLLIQVGGGQIPNWAGPRPGTPNQQTMTNSGIQDYGGQPGKIFANLLVEEATNLSPGMAYWNETKFAFVDSVNGMTSDNRLRPRVSDLSTYSFAMPDAGDVRVNVKLIYRFAFYDLLARKEWFNRQDITVTEWECYGSPRQTEVLRQSCKAIGP